MSSNSSQLRKHIESIYQAAIQSVTPKNLFQSSIKYINEILSIQGIDFDLRKYKKIYIIGAGKASTSMAIEIEDLLGNKISQGIVSSNISADSNTGKIEYIKASHPLPNENSLLAGNKILKLVKDANENDLVIALISGGGSSLLESLPESISLDDYKDFADCLIKSGMDIDKINTLRKAVSNIKGGKLAREIHPATCITLIISDVLGNKLESIASGLTYITRKEKYKPLELLDDYYLTKRIPESILRYLQQNFESNNLEDFYYKNNHHFILGDNLRAIKSAKGIAEQLGYETRIIRTDIIGEAKSVGEYIADFVTKRQKPDSPKCYLFGGETTVRVKGKGIGGRNQELALSTLIHLKDITNEFCFASIGTDGIDGPTDAAGAIINNFSMKKAIEFGIDPAIYLSENNSYEFFNKLDSLIKIGPTGTNVMDIQIMLLI
ncbi:MAG: DUF4147 domain-containing protein [Melioribacteraceae bacterium]|nr:MAG: DUF4147 domain-containing protein [Melioribacteraceae bacterium]